MIFLRMSLYTAPRFKTTKVSRQQRLDTTQCIYCQLPKMDHGPVCPVRRARSEVIKDWIYLGVALLGWIAILCGFWVY
jgi:hypothetical protein